MQDHLNTIIELQNVSFSYTNELVLKDITLSIHKGDYLGIVGPNGGGKSTFLKIILGLLKPNTGTVKLNTQNIGYVPQKTNFDFNFPITAREVVAMGLYGKKGLFKFLGKSDFEKIDQALEQVNMQKFGGRRIGDLSGGQQQRIFIARTIVSDPEVIFLDEPTVGVDNETRNSFFELLKKLNDELNLTLVLITHDMDVILHHGVTEAAFINREVLFYGKPIDLFKTKYIDEHYRGHI